MSGDKGAQNRWRSEGVRPLREHGAGREGEHSSADDGITPPRKGRGRPPDPVARLKREAQADLDRRACECSSDLFDALHARALGDGDDALPALKMLLDRIWPARAKALQDFRLPATHNPVEVGRAMDEVLAGVAAGEIAAEDGAKLVAMLEARLKAYEAAELPARIEELMRAARAVQARSAGFPANEGREGRA